MYNLNSCNFIVFCVLINIGIILSSKPKLNVPRVLLPYKPNYDDLSSNFTLKVQGGGCYKWTSSRDEVTIEEVTSINDCCDEVIVSANSRTSSKLTAIIIANDIDNFTDTGFSLRCDVMVDAMDSLQIVTTTRQLYAEEAPEEFEVRAYDQEGNEFSSLEGQKFIWDLHPITNQDVPSQTRPTVLRFITFKDSPYKTPPSIAPLEANGDQGYMVLVEGIQTGHAKLSVKLAHPVYKKLSSASVNLMVVANLILDPQDVYIMPYTSVKYGVMHLKQGIFHPVDIAHSQYYLQVSDVTVGELESDGIHVTGLSYGSTSVILGDKLVKSSETLKEPTATLHVVEPSYLAITIQPHNNPSLIMGHSYNFVVNLFDKNNNKIFVSQDVVVDTQVSSDYFTLEYSSPNGTFISATPFKTGTVTITAKLSTIKIGPYEEIELSPPLRASQTVDIFHRIIVNPKMTFLPWDPITFPTYKFNLTVEMYNDSVSWSSSNSTLVSVNRWGVCQTNGSGSATITASLVINPYNKDLAQILIQEPLALYIIESVVEVEVNRSVFLPISLSTLYLSSEYFFSMCHKLAFKVQSEQPTFEVQKHILPGSVEKSCAEIHLKSNRGGFSVVSVAYKSTSGLLKSEAILSAYYPLRSLSPGSASTVLALATSRFVIFEGGPLPWIKKPSSHFVKVHVNSYDDEVVAELQPKTLVSRTDIYAVLVICNEIGTFNLTLTVGNKPSVLLPYPKVVNATVTVVCAVPESVVLRPLLESPTCPSLHSHDVTVAHFRKPIWVEVEVHDLEGRKFDNTSSLNLNWRISDKTLVSCQNCDSIQKDSKLLYGFSIPQRVERELLPLGLLGDGVVTVMMTGYSYVALQHISLPILENSLQIHLIDDAYLQPQKLVVFKHEEIKEEVLISGGSGHFQLVSQNSSLALLELIPDEQKVTVIPKGDGNMTLLIQDLCLPGALPVSSSIMVSSITSLDLLLPERVEIGTSVIAEAVVYDAASNVIPVHILMKMTMHIQSDIISVSYKGINEIGNAMYSVNGVVAGDTLLKLSCWRNHSDTQLFSPAKPIQVFPSLRIIPRNITLIVGAVFQVETKGGPYPESAVEFSVGNETVATSSYTGIVTAMALGTTVLRASAFIKDQQPGVISQDAVIVNVIPLDAVRIYSPLRHIETGSIVPLYVIGSDNLTPLSYITAIPPLIFEWSLSNDQIAVLRTPYEPNGIVELNENLGVVRFQAIKPGRVTVTVRVKVSIPHTSPQYQIQGNIILMDNIEIKIFETLKLMSPLSEDARILLSPKAQTTIITNREKEGVLTYAVNIMSRPSASNLVEVSSEGELTAKYATGETVVLLSLEKPFGVTQNIAIGIEVRSISYILANPEVFMDAAESRFLGTLPLGVSHALKLQFHDNRGRIFTSTNVVTEFRLSRFDMINIRSGPGNDTLTITVRDIGTTVLHVWLKDNPLISDYLKINTGPGISPHKTTVPMGGLVCFSTTLRGLNATKGIWKSGSPTFEIDPQTGVGTASVVGKYPITYQISPSIMTTTEVNVVPISKIFIESPTHAISNILDRKTFLPVNFIGEGQSGSTLPCYPPYPPKFQVPFLCELSVESETAVFLDQLFAVAAIHVPERGFGCEVRSIAGPDVHTSKINLRLYIECVVPSRGLQKEVRSVMSYLPFLPAAVPDRTELVLSYNESKKDIILRGRNDVLSSFIVSEEHRYFHVQSEKVDDFSTRFIFTAKEFLIRECAMPETSEVALESVLTHQLIKVAINFDSPGFGRCNRYEKLPEIFGVNVKWILKYQSHAILLFCILITMICLYYGYQAVSSSGYKQTLDQSVFAASTVSQAPVASTSTPFSPIGDVRKRIYPIPSTVPLWTDDKEPVYGVPIFRSSPRPAFEGSPTYS